MNCIMRRKLLNNINLLLLLCLMAIGGCVSFNHDSKWMKVQPYVHPAMGIGGGKVYGSIVVPQDQEHIFFTQALLLSLQDQHLSVTKPKIGLDGVIPDEEEWTTDTATIPRDIIRDYNDLHPDLILPKAIYGISYEGMHDTAEGKFRYNISAHLHERGALSLNWSAVDDERYAGDYFVSMLADSIQNRLNQERTPSP